MLVRCSGCFEQYDREYDVCPCCGHVNGAPAEESFHLNPGAMLQGRYMIGKVIGFGGFGITYKAWDKKLQTVVAIKEYFHSGIVNRAPGSLDVIVYAKKREMEFNHEFNRFIDEARSMAKFGTHSNIVNVYGYFEENQTAYIVMEYLNGVTLSEFIKIGSLGIESSLAITVNICQALKAIHAAGIIHRDVSPDNIMICSDNKIKLIDFGTARFSHDEEAQRTVILKPGYAPPEQYEKLSVQGPWTDIYALGATLYLMLTGIKPDESTNRKIADTLAQPSEINPAVSENVSNTVMKAMALDRHMRFKTVDEFEKGINQEIKVIPLRKEIGNRKRRRLITVLSSALVVIIAVTTFVYFFNKQRIDETLADAKISIWYELTGDDRFDTAKREAYSAVFDAFRDSFANIEIEVSEFVTDEYVSRVLSELEAGDAPTLFETTSIDAAMLYNAVNLNDVIRHLDIKQYNFLDKYETYFPERKQLPLGFIAPTAYVNTTLSGLTSNSISANTITETGTLRQFLAGETEMVLSDTTEFFNVQAALPARYRLLRIDEAAGVDCWFSDIWSIGNCGVNEQKAAEHLLIFMLSDNAQDYLYIRNSSGILPLNKNDLDVFVGVYVDFNGFFDNIDSYTFSMMPLPTKIKDDTAYPDDEPAIFSDPAPDGSLAVEINGQRVIFADQQPIIVDGRILAPAREVFEPLGYTTSWDSKTSTLTLSDNINVILVPIGENVFTINGTAYELDVPARVVDGRAMLPFGAMLDSVGYVTRWDKDRNTVIIITP